MRRAALRVAPAVLAAAALAATASPARAGDDYGGASVVYARGTSLWKIDPRGHGHPTELVTLPGKADDVRAIRAGADGRTLVVDLGGTWYWTRIDGERAAPLTALGCAPGGARLARDGTCVVCASDHGTASIYRLGGPRVDSGVPAAGTTVIGAGAARRLVWAERGAVWAAPVARPEARRAVATEAPLAHFSPSPDGRRALGVFRETEADKDKDGIHELLYTFSLDGQGARRKVIRHAVPIEWSWSSRWVLVQDQDSACVMRAVGGEYKCWKGFTAASIAPDGAWALVLGHRKDADEHAHHGTHDRHHHGKDAPDDGAAPAPAVDAAHDAGAIPMPPRPFSLYRAERDGAFAKAPVLIVRDVDGAAAWLPAPASPAPAAPPSP
jgi:hypothetical protein